MDAVAYTIFDTPVGPCGIAWGANGILAIRLPERSPSVLRRRLADRFPKATMGEPLRSVRDAMGSIVELLEGKKTDLASVKLDMTGLSDFSRGVYQAARTIPAGETLSYGELARRLGRPGAARAVGRALGRNPFALVVPCHRVVAQGGGLVGFSAEGGTRLKERLLRLEGAIP